MLCCACVALEGGKRGRSDLVDSVNIQLCCLTYNGGLLLARGDVRRIADGFLIVSIVQLSTKYEDLSQYIHNESESK
jgi:hypothetical protein